MKNLSPAEYCVQLWGGVRALARELAVYPSTVCRWRKPRTQGGSDGAIPSAQQRRLLELARERSLDLQPADLIEGRQVGP